MGTNGVPSTAWPNSSQNSGALSLNGAVSRNAQKSKAAEIRQDPLIVNELVIAK
jgi:hypothetical protein